MGEIQGLERTRIAAARVAIPGSFHAADNIRGKRFTPGIPYFPRDGVGSD